ncbi:ABC transporter ATP-binding protein [Alteromonas sp. KUL49]|uniref:ABC transporter ATP-binding protein n=1 Tax=Alteromonas sp. KUL49 TaxID=2480798 RepID=UPI00102EF2C0|nr:ABC transporter ATP-binding protein [Alteromonas sp. KUL49]TAP42105.1 ABC transporter ATP-binding protein [Alteromonas sp. KUL49]GEA09687.1 ABC transporter ATP-binding protein [Alteromonas sp. KUL49]
MPKDILKASSLTVSFADHTVLDCVDFSVKQGEVFALLGGNGAGKSTALKTFLGTVSPTSGDAYVLDRSVKKDINSIRKNIAYLPESVTLYGHLSGIENIEYFLSLGGINRTEDDIKQALNRVALQVNAWHKPLSSYSKGMRQKTAIALALLREAPVLFLDEPTSGLDPSAIDKFNQLVASLSEQGTTVFMVTHDVYGACQIAHRIGLLHKGGIVGMFERGSNDTIDTEAVHTAFSMRDH